MQCDTLALSFGTDMVIESDDQAAYGTGLADFWSAQQSQTIPACLFRPSRPEGVAASVLLSRLAGCPFAVKSGGHAAFKGASNVEDGLTIDLGGLNQIYIHPGGDTVSIGPGNTWYDVYTVLEPLNRTVVGGRVAAVGVGGLVLGGMHHSIKSLLILQGFWDITSDNSQVVYPFIATCTAGLATTS